jgi:hypothetical protein
MATQTAARDPNRNVTIQGVDSVGFTDATNVAVNASTHAMLVESTFSPSGTQDVNLTKVGGTAFALGQQLAAASLPVVLTAAQITTLTPLSTVAATQSGTWNITNISGTVSLPTGAATSANQSTANTSLATIAGAVSGTEMQVDVLTMPSVTVTATDLDIRDLSSVTDSVTVVNAGLTELAAAINASSQMDVNIAASGATVPVSNAGLTALNGAITGTEVQVDVVASLPAGTNAIGKLAANSGVDIGDVDVTSVSGTVTTKEVRASTGANSSVADTASSTTILAANANRLGATVANDSSAVLYLLLGSTSASATNYSARLVQYAYYEVPFGYTGQLTGIWASDPGDGAARVTEITA